MPYQKEYATGTTIFIKKDDSGSEVGSGYTVEVYNNGTKTDTMHKDTRKETLDVIKQYKQQYNTNRSFQNEIEIFITYPEKDTVYEENKAENKDAPKIETNEKNIEEIDEKENKAASTSEAFMKIQNIDDILMKQAGHIEMLLNKITNPSAPVKIRIAEEMDDFSMQPNEGDSGASEDSIANEIFGKLKSYSVKIMNSGKEESELKNELYNKIKGWLFKIQDTIKKYSDANGALNVDTIINAIVEKIVSDPEFPELAKEQLKKSAGSPGTNQFSSTQETAQETAQELPKAAQLSANFWRFASTLKGEAAIEDVFNIYVEQNKIEDRKATWEVIENDIEIAFNKGA